ncbi:MAG: paraquat-inducible protein A, partial [Candidatus Poribacteria bacterium]|nr:paraquat-inducible protein A [Candidatus Poribacteria bacterium]
LKLSVFYHTLSGGTPNRGISAFIHKWGRFSMLDVYIVAILILTIRSLPGGAQIKPSWGLLLFTISILLSLYISTRLESKNS